MIIQSMLAEFDHEMKTTRSLLERVPDTQDAWKPHKKSRDLGELSAHIATIPQWGWRIARNTTVDVHPPGGENLEASRFPGTLKNLAIFDQAIRESRAAMFALSRLRLVSGQSDAG